MHQIIKSINYIKKF